MAKPADHTVDPKEEGDPPPPWFIPFLILCWAAAFWALNQGPQL